MKPTTGMHRIARTSLTEIQSFQRDNGERFWTRELVVEDAGGDSYRIGLFSDLPDGLLLPEEMLPEVEQWYNVPAGDAEEGGRR